MDPSLQSTEITEEWFLDVARMLRSMVRISGFFHNPNNIPFIRCTNLDILSHLREVRYWDPTNIPKTKHLTHLRRYDTPGCL